MNNLLIYCPSVRIQFYKTLCKSVHPIPVEFVNGQNAGSFSKLCNSIIRNSREDFVIISNDKARPKALDVHKMYSLFKSGFGFVALYRMGFFGIHKLVVEKVGFFDERFVGGGYEDNDYYLRLKQCDVASYICEEIDYEAGKPSLWSQGKSAAFFAQKYFINYSTNIIYKLIGEENTDCRFEIKDRQINILPWINSVLGPIPLVHYKAHFENILKNYDIVDNVKK